ncbi:MAG: type II CAAX endopeptidase family protein [Clostridia bacterium]|jgi:membrane protease YdiL (CAAX protease family)/heme exporter protein D
MMEIQKDRKLLPYQSFLLIMTVFIIFVIVQVASVYFLSDHINIYQIFCEVAGLAMPVMFFLLTGNRAKDNIHIKMVSIKNVLTVTGITALALPGFMLLATFNTWIAENTVGITPGLEDAVVMGSFDEYIIAVIVMAVVPAICEEIAFRTAFMSGLERFGKTTCFLTVSLFFSLAHMIPEKIVSTFALSMLLCYFIYRTGSVLASVIGHFVNNFIALTITYIADLYVQTGTETDFLETYGISEYGLSFIVWGAISLLMLPVIIMLIRKLKRDTEEVKLVIIKERRFKGEDLAAFLPALLVFVVMFALVIIGSSFIR